MFLEHACKEICIHELLTTISGKNASDTPCSNVWPKVSYATSPKPLPIHFTRKFRFLIPCQLVFKEFTQTACHWSLCSSENLSTKQTQTYMTVGACILLRISGCNICLYINTMQNKFPFRRPYKQVPNLFKSMLNLFSHCIGDV
jgi:hypothetical protein